MPLTAPLPKDTRDFERINIALLPPLPLLASGMDVVVVNGAKWDRELITHLQAEPSGLRVADMVRV